MVDAKTLAARQCQWRTRFVGQQRATPRLDRPQIALMQQRVAQGIACGIGVVGRIEGGLRSPQRIELLSDHGAVHVEVIALVDALLAVLAHVGCFAVARTHALACNAFGARVHALFPEPFSDGTATGRDELAAQGA